MALSDYFKAVLDSMTGGRRTVVLSNECRIGMGVTTWTKENGTNMTAQASTASGFSQLSNKDFVIHIPVNGAELAFSVDAVLEDPIDETEDAYLDVLVSKNADNDALTVDAEAYFAAASDIGNDDAVSTAAQTLPEDLTKVTFTLGNANIMADAEKVSIVITVGGTNDGDIVYIHGARLRYIKKKTVG